MLRRITSFLIIFVICVSIFFSSYIESRAIAPLVLLASNPLAIETMATCLVALGFIPNTVYVNTKCEQLYSSLSTEGKQAFTDAYSVINNNIININTDLWHYLQTASQSIYTATGIFENIYNQHFLPTTALSFSTDSTVNFVAPFTYSAYNYDWNFTPSNFEGSISANDYALNIYYPQYNTWMHYPYSTNYPITTYLSTKGTDTLKIVFDCTRLFWGQPQFISYQIDVLDTVNSDFVVNANNNPDSVFDYTVTPDLVNPDFDVASNPTQDTVRQLIIPSDLSDIVNKTSSDVYIKPYVPSDTVLDSAPSDMVDLFKNVLPVVPFQQTFDKINNINTSRTTPPCISIDLHSMLDVIILRFSTDTVPVTNPFHEGTYVLFDFAMLENYTFGGYDIVTYFRSLIAVGFLYTTVLYCWNKIIPKEGIL